MENENWIDIVGYEGLYRVSNLGRIKRLKSIGKKKDSILKCQNHKSGYIYVKLSRYGNYTQYKVEPFSLVLLKEME